MGFSGGGSNITKPHTHDSNIVQDGGSLAANVTQFGLSAGSILYSDGSNIQELAVGSDTNVLTVSGSTPGWGANTSNPLIKVSKTFADISTSTFEMDIYSLPQDAAAVNIWTDITTIFDLSTALTIGDTNDNNGWAEATDWTSGTGLTDATRGAYVTSFKTMRSTSGTTAIKAYGFQETGGTVFSQLTGGGGLTISNGNPREEIAQQFNAGHVLIGETVAKCSFYLSSGAGSPTGNISAHIRQADGTNRQTSLETVDASTVGAETEYNFTFTPTVIAEDDMITCCLDNGTGTASNTITCVMGSGTMTNGTLYKATACGSGYAEVSGEQFKMTATYGTFTSDTQGEVDFYLQVVD